MSKLSRRGSTMLPFTRVRFGALIFDPLPFGYVPMKLQWDHVSIYRANPLCVHIRVPRNGTWAKMRQYQDMDRRL